MGAAFRTLSAGALVSSGASADFSSGRRDVSLVLAPTGVVTGGVVAVQASQDGTNWVTLHYWVPQTGLNLAYNNTHGAYRFWRASVIAAVTGGGSVTVTVMEAGR